MASMNFAAAALRKEARAPDVQRPPGMELLSITFERDAFDALVDSRGWSPEARRRLARSALLVEPAP